MVQKLKESGVLVGIMILLTVACGVLITSQVGLISTNSRLETQFDSLKVEYAFLERAKRDTTINIDTTINEIVGEKIKWYKEEVYVSNDSVRIVRDSLVTDTFKFQYFTTVAGGRLINSGMSYKLNIPTINKETVINHIVTDEVLIDKPVSGLYFNNSFTISDKVMYNYIGLDYIAKGKLGVGIGIDPINKAYMVGVKYKLLSF